jgi:protein arginine kinase activator
MLCQNCQERPANVHFTQIINNTKAEMYLCEQCANEKGQFGFGPSLNINDFLSGFIGFGSGSQHTEAEPRETHCDICGMSYEDFRKTGKLGCSNCYRIYGEKLNPILKRLHGNMVHTGKVPAKVSEKLNVSKEIDKLRELLAKAVQSEEYEKAAEFRDKIKQMEGEH